MSRFLDLDAVVVPDLDVQLGGTVYRVPGSPDVPRMLRWMKFQEAADSDAVELLTDIYEDLLDLFRERQPDLEALPIRQEQIMPLFEALFEATGEGAAPDPTPRSSPRKRKS
jgi:hypothetical protein